jgi:CheY-like chemotaxis protein
VLAVDDDDINRTVVEHMFADDDLDIISASGGQEAIDLYKAHTFDVVLMDISMPGMDGPTAVQKIREYEELNNLARTPVIATTAHALSGDKERFLALGMDDYLPKPLQYEDLIAQVKHWAGRDQKQAA